MRSWLSVVSYRLALRLPRLWVHVPIGNAREDGDKADQNLLTNVRVKYRQFSFDLCLIKGLASCLQYIDIENEASCLINTCNIPVDPGIRQLVKMVKEYMLKYAKKIRIGIDYNSSKHLETCQRKKRKENHS